MLLTDKMKETKKKYDANITAGGLLHNEFTAISPILTDDDFVDKIEKERELNSFIGIPTESARKRVITEIIRRYEIVPTDFWFWYLTLTQNKQKLALFYVCLKTYPLVFDLHLEVAMKKYKTGDYLTPYSVQMRLDELSASDSEIGNWSENTLDKINSQYRKVLKNCGLLTNETLQAPSNIADSFWEYFDSIGDGWFKELCFK